MTTKVPTILISVNFSNICTYLGNSNIFLYVHITVPNGTEQVTLLFNSLFASSQNKLQSITYVHTRATGGEIAKLFRSLQNTQKRAIKLKSVYPSVHRFTLNNSATIRRINCILWGSENLSRKQKLV